MEFLPKLLANRRKTVATLTARITAAQADPHLKGTLVLRTMVDVWERRLARVRQELVELERAAGPDPRQKPLPLVKPKT